MARVPVSSGNMVDRQSRGSTPLAAPDMTSGGRAIGQAAAGFGAELVQFGEQQDAIAAELDQAAAKKVDNAYSEWSRKRLWTDEGAFYSQEGFNAANARPVLEKEIQAKRDEFLGQATTPRMRQMISDALDRRIGADLEGVSRYATAQFGVEAKRQSVARQANARNDAMTYYADPVRFAQELEVGRSEIRGEGARSGMAPEVIKDEVSKWESGVFRGVAAGMIQRGGIEEASAWIEQHRKVMREEDLQDLDGALYRPMLERQADGVVDDILGYAPATTEGQAKAASTISAGRGGGNIVGRMVQITAVSESGNRERDKGGRLVTSVKGAQGKMQVMPGTQRDPGFGVTPMRDNSDAERTRVGQEYLGKMMERYGNDPAKAWAAYNWGPGNLDKALKDHGDAWLANAPAETRAYVRANMAALGGRGGAEVAQQEPREHDLAAALERLDALNLPFDLEQATRRQLMERVGLDERLLDRKRAAAVEQAETILDQAERSGKPITRESQIPAAVWNSMGPDQRMQVRGVIERNAKPADRVTDYGAYTRISDLYATDPRAFAKLDPSSYRNAFSDSDYEKVLGWRREVLQSASGNGGEKQATISGIRTVTSQLRESVGLSATGIKNAEAKTAMEKRIYNFETAVERGVELWQRANPGKAVPDAVVREIGERQLTKTQVDDKAPVKFWFERGTSPTGRFKAFIPISDLNRLRAIGRRELGREPTQAEIVTAYQSELEGR